MILTPAFFMLQSKINIPISLKKNPIASILQSKINKKKVTTSQNHVCALSFNDFIFIMSEILKQNGKSTTYDAIHGIQISTDVQPFSCEEVAPHALRAFQIFFKNNALKI